MVDLYLNEKLLKDFPDSTMAVRWVIDTYDPEWKG